MTNPDPLMRYPGKPGQIARPSGGTAQTGQRALRGGDMAFVTATRSAEEFARAARHSQRVRFLKRALPIGGAAAILILLAAYLFSMFALPGIDPGEARIVDGKLVMNNPKISGSDSSKRPYTLTADRAVQDALKPTRITLEKIAGRISIDESNTADVIAGIGIYDSLEKTLVLSETVSVDTADGMSIRLEGASIDIESGSLTTDRPVSVDTGRVQVSADSLIVEDEGKRIVFENRVRMTLQPIDPEKAAGAKAN